MNPTNPPSNRSLWQSLSQAAREIRFFRVVFQGMVVGFLVAFIVTFIVVMELGLHLPGVPIWVSIFIFIFGIAAILGVLWYVRDVFYRSVFLWRFAQQQKETG